MSDTTFAIVTIFAGLAVMLYGWWLAKTNKARRKLGADEIEGGDWMAVVGLLGVAAGAIYLVIAWLT